MGYSCTARAALTRDAIQTIMDREYPKVTCSNNLPDGGFWETGRERADGAITGTVWRPLTAEDKAKWQARGYDTTDWTNRVTKRGSFKINPEGKIERFPGLPKGWAKEAEEIGAKRYAEIYERIAA